VDKIIDHLKKTKTGKHIIRKKRGDRFFFEGEVARIFSMTLKELSSINYGLQNDDWKKCTLGLLEIWMAELGSGQGKLEVRIICGTCNSLSKMSILNLRKWGRDEQNKLKSFVVNLIDQGNQTNENFSSWDIANILNALSKWNVLDSNKWAGKVEVTTNNKPEQIDKIDLFKFLIVKLVDQGNSGNDEFKFQEIANILNALSKRPVDEVPGAKDFIIKLVNQGNWLLGPKNKTDEKFRSQAIANSYDALSKFNIFGDGKWEIDEQNKFKSFIVGLARRWIPDHQDTVEGEKFNHQQIANTFNAFVKLGIFDNNKWTADEQGTLTSLIINLAEVDESYRDYIFKDIFEIYNALYCWNVFHNNRFSDDKDKPKLTDFIKRLESRVLDISREPSVRKPGADIEFISKVINGWPKLKLKDLMISENDLLVSLMKCLSAGIDGSENDTLNEPQLKEDILSVLKSFTNIINWLNDKSNLIGKFDESIKKIHDKFSKLGFDCTNEIIEKLCVSGIVKRVPGIVKDEKLLSPEFKNNLLAGAIRCGRIDLVKNLIDEGVDIDVEYQDGWTTLPLAALCNHTEIVEFLTNRGADVSESYRDGWSPLHSAVEKGNVGMVKFLVGQEVSIHEDIMSLAIVGGHIEIVEFLVEEGANVNAVYEHGCTPLFLAAAVGHIGMMEALLSKEASIDMVDKNGHVLLYHAIRTSKVDVYKCVVNHMAKLEVIGLYVSQENLQLKSELIGRAQSDYDIEVANSYKRSFQRYSEEVRRLIEEDKPLYDFLMTSDINELIDIWEANEDTFSKLDEKRYGGMKERYSGYTDVLINKANKVKKEIFLHNHKQLIDVLSVRYDCDMKTMEFTNIRKFFRLHKDEIVVDLAKVEKSMIDFVDFSDVKRRCVPRLELQALALLSGSLDNPSVERCLVTIRGV